MAIPDLWRLRELRHLTQAATIVHDSPLALALRQETQMLHANGERVRPPRELAWALALFLYSLEPPHPPAQAAGRGAGLFQVHCSGCHSDTNGSGKPVVAGRVGVDAALATGRARGTGTYRPAPLVALQFAAPFLHTGEVPTLEALLDPARLEPSYDRGLHVPGPIPGHPFGTDLPSADRTALVAWLQAR